MCNCHKVGEVSKLIFELKSSALGLNANDAWIPSYQLSMKFPFVYFFALTLKIISLEMGLILEWSIIIVIIVLLVLFHSK